MENQTIVNQYAMTRQIGEGGMAQVWEAQHLHLDTRVAIKFLLPRFAGDPELEERFLDEARRHAQLQHPNIVPVTDFFPVDGHSYMVMQYIEGRNLEERIRDQHGPLPVDEIHAIS
jgi:serine/threonine protein kinase